MSREDLPKAPPAEAFRNSVLTSITERDKLLSSPCAKISGKRPLSALFQDDDDDQPLAPPPPVRRSTSIGAPISSTQQSLGRPLLRRRSSLFDSLPGRSRAGSLQAVPETNPPSFTQRFSQDSTLLGDDVSASDLPAVETPERRPRRSLFGAVMEKLATKASPEPGFRSPSGKSILDIVNRITSPFRFHSPPAKRRLISSPVTTPRQPEDSQSSLHDDDNWREAPIRNGQAEIVDWTLKRRIQLECHPPESLTQIWQSKEWLDALSYWNYHSTEVLDPVLGVVDKSKPLFQPMDKANKAKISEKPKRQDPVEELAARLVKSVRSISGITPERRWQQSFRSLFLQWRRHMEKEVNDVTAVLDHYFYCISEDHVVLFRIDYGTDHWQPRVLLSKCGEPFRQVLRDSGVERMEVLQEPQSTQTLKEKVKNHVMSPTVKADLEALRKAQAFGEVAGAEVSIKIKPHKKDSKPSANQSMAITVVGMDNVAAFFEVYFNRLGRVQERDDELTRTLPTLICPRGLGPFWHASLDFLEARPVKPKTSETMHNGILEIQGSVILPSVIRQLVALSARKMHLLHAERPAESSGWTIRSPSKEKAGTHYVVVHAVEEEESILARSKVNKNRMELASLLFNNVAMHRNLESEGHLVGNTNFSISDCRSGTTLQLVVWDLTRKDVAACKVGELT